MAVKDPKDPSTTSYAYDAMLPKWEKIEAVLGGTEAMREAGLTYLPQHAEETDRNYQERKKTAILFNMLELTLDSLVGRPFSRKLDITKTPTNFQEMAKNIDLRGNDITVFCRKWFREGAAKGLSHVLVDFPSITAEERKNRTLADDIREGLRPFFNFICPENLIYAETKIIQGHEIYTHVRIKEIETQRDGFMEVFKERIRVLEPGAWYLYEKRKVKGKRKATWVLIDSGYTNINFIPLVTFYANRREDLMLTKPPLEDLADLNIRHWQSSSDQINVLTVARFPMLAVSGATDTSGEAMTIGPKALLGTKKEGGRFYYVEHSGKAIEAGRQELLDLEEMMASYGAEFLKRRPGNATATARALDSAEATSPLQDMVLRFNDSVNIALEFFGLWGNIDEIGEIEINKDFQNDRLSEAQINALIKARENRDISRHAFLTTLMKGGVLPDSLDLTKIEEELQKENDFSPQSSEMEQKKELEEKRLEQEKEMSEKQLKQQAELEKERQKTQNKPGNNNNN